MYLSVVICTYNRGKYLPMVLDSLKNQTYPRDSFEILLINNNSPDNTSDIVATYLKENPNIPVKYMIELNQGISYARNRGVNEASGDIVVFIDDDETVEAIFLSEISKFFLIYPNVGISAGPVIPVYETEKPKWLSHFTMRTITGAYDKGNEIKILSPKDYPGTGHACFRKALFEEYGEFNTDLGRKGDSLMGAEDKDFFLRLMEGGEKCYYLPTAKIYHHIPGDKLTDAFFNKLTYQIGRSERIRTLSISKKSFYNRIFMEIIKWIASIVLWIGYSLGFKIRKGNKLIQFRMNVTKGLLRR
jgi:glycosyltransferase involved in cell wall biosynthesis